MATKKRMNGIVLVGGVLAIVILFVLFVPAILGATASQGDLEKYNGSSQQGNDTVRIAKSMDTFFVGLTNAPLQIAAIFLAIVCVMITILMFARKR